MTALDGLRRARALISDRSRWTTGTNARDKDGLKVLPIDSCAVRWCAQGAIFRSCPDERERKSAWIALNEATPCHHNITSTNDNIGYAAIMKAFDKAIAAEEAKQLDAIPVAETEPRPALVTT